MIAMRLARTVNCSRAVLSLNFQSWLLHRNRLLFVFAKRVVQAEIAKIHPVKMSASTDCLEVLIVRAEDDLLKAGA